MSDLVRVVDKNGVETVVGREWLTRWPDDFTEVDPTETPTPVGGEETAAPAATEAPTGRKAKE